jgi:ribosomal protein L6P/L9E
MTLAVQATCDPERVVAAERTLTIQGVGYRAEVAARQSPQRSATLRLFVGFGHPVEVLVPDNITVLCPSAPTSGSATAIVIKGNNVQEVAQFAAKVRLIRPAHPLSPLPAGKKGILRAV